MDHQWRQGPLQGTICPTCSAFHFPFCAPHPSSVNQHPPRLPADYMPGFNPYGGSLVPQHDPPNWHRTPNFDGVPYGQHQLQNEYSGIGFVPEGDRNLKRMRVDDTGVGSGGLVAQSYINPEGVYSENERRLKLIRDHGSNLSGPATEITAGYNRETNRYTLKSSVYEDYDNPKAAFDPVNRKRKHYNGNEFHPGIDYNVRDGGCGDEVLQQSQYRMNNVNQQLQLPYSIGEVPNGSYNSHDSVQQIHYDGLVAAREPQHVHYGQPVPRANVAYHEERSSGTYGMQHSTHTSHDFHSQGHISDGRQPFEYRVPSQDNNQSVAAHKFFYDQMGRMDARPVYSNQPPLPSSPPPPLPLEAPVHPLSGFRSYTSPPKTSSSLFPVPVSRTSMQYVGGDQTLPLTLEKAKVIDASQLFKKPHRSTRPDHFVIILRGLPGSGKSYLAKMLRDLEVENDGDAPRIHSMDDYFMTEVEKIEDSNVSKSSSSARGKKSIKKVMEYCYEPEMEEAYRASMLKAFRKTVEEGVFTFIIVDDRNLRVADFAQFWAIGKRSGYEVYILEAAYKDPAGCAARNVHDFTQDDIQKMAGEWEEAPPLYMQLDIKSLFHGDDLRKSEIQEVDMDMEDDDGGDSLSRVHERKPEKIIVPQTGDYGSDVFDASKDGKRWDAEEVHLTDQMNLGRSKWSDDLDEEDAGRTKTVKGNVNALSGLIRAYKEGKSVHWGDKSGNTGFSIGALRNTSLVIGPGAGYNLKSNPLREDDKWIHGAKSEGHSVFHERLRAEHESFKAVFDRRRQRVGKFNFEDE